MRSSATLLEGEERLAVPLLLLLIDFGGGGEDEIAMVPLEDGGTDRPVEADVGGLGGDQSTAVCSGPYSHVTSESLSLYFNNAG